MSLAFDLVRDECIDPEPTWHDSFPYCSVSCPNYRLAPDASSCALVANENTRANGRACVPTVQALSRAIAGHRLPLWATPPAELVPLEMQDVAEERDP